jgi:hypothetical protein
MDKIGGYLRSDLFNSLGFMFPFWWPQINKTLQSYDNFDEKNNKIPRCKSNRHHENCLVKIIEENKFKCPICDLGLGFIG